MGFQGWRHRWRRWWYALVTAGDGGIAVHAALTVFQLAENVGEVALHVALVVQVGGPLGVDLRRRLAIRYLAVDAALTSSVIAARLSAGLGILLRWALRSVNLSLHRHRFLSLAHRRRQNGRCPLLG